MLNKVFVYFVVVALLNACTFGGYNKNLDFKVKNDAQDLNDNAIIIFKPNTFINNGTSFGQIVWENQDTKQLVYSSEFSPYGGGAKTLIMIPIVIVVFIVTFGWIFIPFSKASYTPMLANEYVALKLPVGKYNLKKIITTNAVELKPFVYNFEVEKGEIVYLGDLQISKIYTGSVCVNTVDKINDVETFLQSKHPQLVNKPIKRTLLKSIESNCDAN